MGSLEQFLQNMDWSGLLMLLMSAVAALFCITVHELSHGLAALALGDTTAKDAGRLTLNPVRHIDPFGLLLMVTVRVGWAKPVPVNMRKFKHPKWGMAVTALAGPCSNFITAFLALLLTRLVWQYAPGGTVWNYIFTLLCQIAILSIGLGVFNLLPMPPLDGSKILFSLLPERAYYFILRHERKVALLVIALVWIGLLDGPLSFLITGALRVLCRLTGVPYAVFGL